MLDEKKVQKVITLSQELNKLQHSTELDVHVLTKEEHDQLVEKNQDKIAVSYTHLMVVKGVLNVIYRSKIYPPDRESIFNALMDFIEFLVQDEQEGGIMFEKWIDRFIDISIKQIEVDLAKLKHRIN